MSESTPQVVTNRAIELRSNGMTWRQITEIIEKEGYKTSVGKPFNQNYVYSLVQRRKKKIKKGVAKSRAKKTAQTPTPTNGATKQFKSFVKTTVDLDLPPTKKLNIIVEALDSLQ